MSNAANLATLKADLALYEAARLKILNAEEVTIGGTRLRRASLEMVEAKIKALRVDIDRLEGGFSHSNPLFKR